MKKVYRKILILYLQLIYFYTYEETKMKLITNLFDFELQQNNNTCKNSKFLFWKNKT